jgi:hypothetical protein
VKRTLGEDTMRKETLIAFVLYEYQTHTTRHFFSSACLWAAPSIRSPVRSEPKRQPARGWRRKRLSVSRVGLRR